MEAGLLYSRGMGGGLVDLDIQFQRDMETAQTRSRAETPDCLPAEQVIQLGIGAAGNMGIFCTRPDLPLAGNSFVPMDGNCIQSSCCHSNDPTLNGEPLKHAAWELRVTCVGAAVENLNNFSDLQWSVLQGIVSGEAKETLSREETQLELEKYMESGSYSGNVGDILPQLAADNLNQPLLVIEIEKCRVKNATWVVPGAIFGGGEQHEGDPIVLVKQLQHYEPLLTKDKESARLKYQQWKASKRVHVSGDDQLPVTCKGDEGVRGERRDRTPSQDRSKRPTKNQPGNSAEMHELRGSGEFILSKL